MGNLILPDWHPKVILERHAIEIEKRHAKKSEFLGALREAYRNSRPMVPTGRYIQGQLLNDSLQRIQRESVADKDQYSWMRTFTPRALPVEADDDEVCRTIKALPAHKTLTSYFVYNSALATTAAPVKQPTGAAIRTMVQVRAALSVSSQVVAWGFSFDGSAAATPGQVELFDNSAAATMSTAYAAADFQPYYPVTATANTAGSTGVPFNLSTTTSGFATAAVTEGTVAAYRGADLVMAPPTGPYVLQFPLGREFQIVVQNYLRVRVTFGTTINMYIWLLLEV